MSPFTTLLTRWVETFANESASLDSLTRTRLRALTGRSIAVEIDPPGETITLHFEDDAIRLSQGRGDAPAVIVRGPAIALASAFLGGTGRGGLSIDGDDVVLSQFRSIVRDFRPEVFAPLENLVGKEAAQSITNVLEIGFSALAAIGRSLGDEGTRLAREGVRHRYLSAREFESFLESLQALRVRVDRLTARTDMIERDSRVQP